MTHESVFTACVCGDVFSASGKPAAVRAKHKAWSKKHKDCVGPPCDAPRTFWLSFCDTDRPVGTQFLGACVIDVTPEEADAARIDVLLRFPFAGPGAEWLAAAVTKAHAFGCNPGGEVASAWYPTDKPELRFYQRGVLMDRATIDRIDAEIEAAK